MACKVIPVGATSMLTSETKSLIASTIFLRMTPSASQASNILDRIFIKIARVQP